VSVGSGVRQRVSWGDDLQYPGIGDDPASALVELQYGVLHYRVSIRALVHTNRLNTPCGPPTMGCFSHLRRFWLQTDRRNVGNLPCSGRIERIAPRSL